MQNIREVVDAIYRNEHARILATLIRLLGDFDLAEDAMQTAIALALEQWPRSGVPANPPGWLISTGRFKAIDAIRKEARTFAALYELVSQDRERYDLFPEYDESDIEDDRLRLIFTCCHPALSTEGQVALTLRDVCGMSTEEIARAFLTAVPTIAQRIVRAKAKIRERKIPYRIPPIEELPERMHSVLQVTYLLFNEGYYATSGESLTRQILSDEAIRLGRILAELMPDSEVFGLLGMMLLNEARRASRVTISGDIVLLADQDRSLWKMDMIAEGEALVADALSSTRPGALALQAGITAEHVTGAIKGHTDWSRIIGLYNLILADNPSPIVKLNRAAAISMRDGPLAGLALVGSLLADGELDGYGLAHSMQADCYRRLGLFGEARQAYARALTCTNQAAERRFLEGRMREVSQSSQNANSTDDAVKDVDSDVDSV